MLAHARPHGGGAGGSTHRIGHGLAQGGDERVRELGGRAAVHDPAEGGGRDDLLRAAARRRDDRAVAQGSLEDRGGQPLRVHRRVDEHVGAAVQAHDGLEIQLPQERHGGVGTVALVQLVLDRARAGHRQAQGDTRELGAQARESVQQGDDALLGDEAARVGDDDLGVLTSARPLTLVAVVGHRGILGGHRVVPHARGLDPEVTQPLVAVA